MIAEHGSALTGGPRSWRAHRGAQRREPGQQRRLRRRDGDWEIQGDPTEAAFLVAERKLGVTERRVAALRAGRARSRSPRSAR